MTAPNHGRMNDLIRGAARANRITPAAPERDDDKSNAVNRMIRQAAGREAADPRDAEIAELEAAIQRAPTTEGKLPFYRSLVNLYKERGDG